MICTIVGTGPELDTVNFNDYPKLVIAINYAGYIAPCQYIAVMDRKVVIAHKKMFENKALISSRRTILASGMQNHYIEEVEGCVYSIEAAVQFAIDCNAEYIYFIGCDGSGARAECVKDYYGYEDEEVVLNNNVRHHDKIKHMMIKNMVMYSGLN